MPEKHSPEKKEAIERFFCTFAEKAASYAGAPLAFITAISFVLAGLVMGPIFNFSSQWQFIMSATPSLVTFLLVFLIQNSQNRETRAVQLKLNELIRATHGAHTAMVNLEKLTEGELKIIADEYELLAGEARKKMERGQTDQGVPEILIPQPSVTHPKPT